MTDVLAEVRASLPPDCTVYSQNYAYYFTSSWGIGLSMDERYVMLRSGCCAAEFLLDSDYHLICRKCESVSDLVYDAPGDPRDGYAWSEVEAWLDSIFDAAGENILTCAERASVAHVLQKLVQNVGCDDKYWKVFPV